MKLTAIYNLAYDLLEKYELTDWDFDFDRSKRRRGVCHYSTKTITVSNILTPQMSDDEVLDLLLHEIAHALVGPKVQAHGWEWYRKCVSIGGSGERLATDNAQAPYNYVGICPNGHLHYRHRLTAKAHRVSCGKCSTKYDSRYTLFWERTDNGH